MAKRLFILFWLFAAYAVVFAHSVVPHHHHEEQAQAAHHHHDHHDPEAEEEPDSQEGNTDGHTGNFHLFPHQGATGDCFLPGLNDPGFPPTPPLPDREIVALLHRLQQLARLCDEGPPLQHFERSASRIPLIQLYAYFYPVKAPPALS